MGAAMGVSAHGRLTCGTRRLFSCRMGTPPSASNSARDRLARNWSKNLAQKLQSLLPKKPDKDDIALVNRWAEFLELKDWFTWVGFEQVEDGYATS